MKQDARGKVVDLRSRQIPRNKQGDPSWSRLGCEDLIDPTAGDRWEPGSLLETFAPDEIVVMCNRYLYQQEYQRTVHRQRERSKAEKLKPLIAKLRELFDVGPMEATDEQIEQASKALAQIEQTTKGEQR